MTGTQEMEQVTCNSCGVLFFVPAVFMGYVRRDGDSIFCPSGHELTYTAAATVATKQTLTRELAEARAEIVRLKDQLVTIRQRAEQAEAKAAEPKPRRRLLDYSHAK